MYDRYLYRTHVLEIACYRNWSNVLMCSTSWFGFDNVEHFLICPIGEVYNKEEGKVTVLRKIYLTVLDKHR